MSSLLQWVDGGNLYVRSGGRRKYIGSVIVGPSGMSWAVWVRGEWQIDLDSEAKAREWLEHHAAGDKGFA